MKDGGPAFPCHPGVDNPMYDGMTLRDYLAAKAMQGQLSAPNPVKTNTKGIAKLAYVMADDMLKAREE